jgi:hypothetical protein
MISNIKYGLIPYGAGIGQRALLIETQIDESTDNIYDNFKDQLKAFKLEKEYLNAINGTSSVFLFFTGNIVLNAYAKQLEDLLTKISKESVNVQKTLKLAPDKIRPPFMVWAGAPIELSSTRQGIGDVYQYFNVVYILLKKDVEFNLMGLQQMLNHQFSSLCICDDYEFINELKEKFNLNNKVCLISTKNHVEIQKECLKNSYRYYQYFDSKYILNLNGEK